MLIAHASGEQSSRKARLPEDPERSASALQESNPVLLLCGRNAGREHADCGREIPRVGPQRAGALVESAIAEVAGAWIRDGRGHFADASQERRPRKGALLKPPESGLPMAKSHLCHAAGTTELYVVVRVGRTDTVRPAGVYVFQERASRK